MTTPRTVGLGTRIRTALTRMVFGTYLSGRSLSWFLPRTKINYAAEVGDVLKSDIVMACILWIMRTFPEAPIALHAMLRDGSMEPMDGHPALRLLRNPNPHHTTLHLWAATMLSYHADGNAYWLIVRSRAGLPAQLWWVPHTIMEPAFPSDGSEYISHYWYKPNERRIAIRAEDVVHFRMGLDPDDWRRGLSPLKAAMRELFSDAEAANWTAALLRNGGVPGVMVSPKTWEYSIGEGDVEATKEYFRTAFTGDRRGEPLALSGPTDVQQFGFSPEQMDLTALRRVPEERVSGQLGIPAIVAGLGAGLDRSTFANMAEAREMAYESNIIPTQRVIAETLNRQFLQRNYMVDGNQGRRLELYFDNSNVRVLQEDENQKAIRYGAMVAGGFLKVSEARQAFNYPWTPADEVYLRSAVLVEVPAGQPAPRPRANRQLDETRLW